MNISIVVTPAINNLLNNLSNSLNTTTSTTTSTSTNTNTNTNTNTASMSTTPALTAAQANQVAGLLSCLTIYINNWNNNASAIQKYVMGQTLSAADTTKVQFLIQNMAGAFLQVTANSADISNITNQSRNYYGTYAANAYF